MIYRTVTIRPKINNSIVAVTPSITGDVSVTAGIITKIRSANFDIYTGPTEFTPSEETQTAETENTVLTSNIIINPVPSNYARMAWNGSTILFY